MPLHIMIIIGAAAGSQIPKSTKVSVNQTSNQTSIESDHANMRHPFMQSGPSNS
jgi:hypothetical protein